MTTCQRRPPEDDLTRGTARAQSRTESRLAEERVAVLRTPDVDATFLPAFGIGPYLFRGMPVASSVV